MSQSPTPGTPNLPVAGRFRRRWLAGVLLIAALAAAALVTAWALWRNDPPAVPDPFPLTPISLSPFLNTGPNARYVGSAACRACHASHEVSFRRTGMGRSMAEVDAALAPADAVFDHAPSKRRYQVCRKDGKLWHRELLLTSGPGEVVLSEYPVRYVVGSGHHSLTYLVEADGFLVESPVTWYTARKAWAMSPGYDNPDQVGFERAVGEGCLICHVGQAEAVGVSLHRMRVTEAAIGCERCHGPGSVHLERHADKGGERPPGAIDYTIVNPVHLSRNLAEAVCQQCHLRSNAVVVGRGRKLSEYRPGLPLEDFRQDYMLAAPEAAMTVVGHVEQMRLSRCYQGSDTLSCLTCHDPHHEPRPKEKVAYYKSFCLTCHQPERCTVTALHLKKESPDNNCVHCHMPSSPTEIPHLAFTHHRIGIHDKPAAATKQPVQPLPRADLLKPLLDLSQLSDIDRKRSLGLGYLEAANREKRFAESSRLRSSALDLLTEVRAAGLRDGALEASLARLRFDMELDGVLPLAETALAHADLIGQDRCNALFLSADAHAAAGRPKEAVAALRELATLRRHAVDWLLLADCEKALGNDAGMEKALQTAVGIDPRRWKVHQYLAEHYRGRGDKERAAWHEQRAVP
jgi:hypothetical protein